MPGLTDQSGRSPQLVGRSGELAVLDSAFFRATRGEGGLVLLSGEPGIGKSRLARELATNAARQGALVATGAAYEGEQNPPYGLWTEVLAGIVQATGADAVRANLGPRSAIVGQLIPALAVDELMVAPLAPGEERLRLQDAVIHLLSSLGRPLVLILDDLQWADRDSLRLLRVVGRFLAQSSALVVGIHREPDPALDPGEPLGEALAYLRRESDAQRLHLTGLSRGDVADLLDTSSGADVPGALAETVHRVTGGNPFYAREVFLHLVEERKIVDLAGRWWTEFSLNELGIPAGIRQVVGARVARLGEGALRLLQAASAFSGGFDTSLVQAVLGLDDEPFLAALDAVLSSGFFVASTGGRYDFAHAIVRQAIQEQLSPDRRARLHRSIAAAIERTAGPNVADWAAELANQYHASVSLAGADRGVQPALIASQQARRSYSPERAVTYLRIARDLARTSDPATRAEVLCRLAIAESDAISLEAAAETAEEALIALTETSAAKGEVAAFLATLGRALKDAGAAGTVWEPLVQRGLLLVGDDRDLTWARLSLLLRRTEDITAGEVRAVRWIGHDPEAIRIAREQGTEEDYARTLEPVDWSSPEETRVTLALARSWREPKAILRALTVVSNTLFARHGALREAADLAAELLTVAERHGAIAEQVEALCQLTTLGIGFGDVSAALRYADQARGRLARLGPEHALQSWTPGLAFYTALATGGDWQAIAASAQDRIVDSPSSGASVALLCGGIAALAFAWAGDTESSRRTLVDLVPALDRAPPEMYTVNVAIPFATLAAWETSSAWLAEPLRDQVRRWQSTGIGEPPFCSRSLSAALCADLLGNRTEAQDWFALARRDLVASGQRALLSVVDFAEGRSLQGTDQNAAERLFDAADRSFRETGMSFWAERVKQARTATTASARPDSLTGREVEVLRLIAAGLTDRQIADRLVLSHLTVRRHVANIYTKIGANGRADATRYAIERL